MRCLSFLTVLLAIIVVTACDGNIDAMQEHMLADAGEVMAIEGGAGSVLLIAGQSYVAGSVHATVTGDELKIRYETAPGWCMYETHLHVASSLAGIPRTNFGNPRPGRFMSKGTHDCETTVEYTYSISSLNLTTTNPLLVAAHAVVRGTDDTEQCELIYGIENATGNIFSLNPITFNHSLLFAAGSNPSYPNWPNTLGFDEANGRLYYAARDNQIWFYEFQTGIKVAAGSLSTTARSAGATFANGKLYYIPHNGPDDLREVTLNAAGVIVSDLILHGNISPNTTGYLFGDLAYKDGFIYFSGRRGSGDPAEFAKIELATGALTTISLTEPLMQLAFNRDRSVLYGHVTSGTGEFYEIDINTGTRGPSIGNFDGRLFNDLSEGVANCPGGEETAWGQGTRFRTPGNWGTYFTINR
jgi:hypothetical protein